MQGCLEFGSLLQLWLILEVVSCILGFGGVIFLVFALAFSGVCRDDIVVEETTFRISEVWIRSI